MMDFRCYCTESINVYMGQIKNLSTIQCSVQIQLFSWGSVLMNTSIVGQKSEWEESVTLQTLEHKLIHTIHNSFKQFIGKKRKRLLSFFSLSLLTILYPGKYTLFMSARVWYHHVLTIRKERISYTKKQQRISRLVNEQEKKSIQRKSFVYYVCLKFSSWCWRLDHSTARL